MLVFERHTLCLPVARQRRPQLRSAVFPASATAPASGPHQRRICYKAEHSAVGTNLRFLVTNCAGNASQGFAFYNDCGECANRIEEFKTGFRVERWSMLPLAGQRLFAGSCDVLVNFFGVPLLVTKAGRHSQLHF
jgi:hypothetical protein